MFNINRLRAAITRENGLAKANRFAVNIFAPPAVGNNEDINLFANSVTIPGKNIESYEYPLNALANSVKHPNGYTFEDIEINFNLTNTYATKRLFDRWHDAIINKDYMLHYPDNYEAVIVILQLDESGNFVYGIRLLDAYPTSVGSISLSNESTNTISQMSATFTYTHLENI